MTTGRDLPTLVRWAREAEDAGFDAVMVSEHVVLGPDAGADGVMGNPREYALPGNQDPFTPWPGSLMLLGAIASVTTRIRLAAAAILAPLKHPLALARDIGTVDLLSEGRLVVQPTVSWSRDEYAAMNVPFEKRGKILDEQLEIWELLWRGSPVSYSGEHFSFEDVYFEPRAYRPDGPRMWFGGQHLHPKLLNRLVKYAHGPQVPMTVNFPGPKGSMQVRVAISPQTPSGNSGFVLEGPWALFRLFQSVRLENTAGQAERFRATIAVEDRKTVFEVTAKSVQNPLGLKELAQFHCPLTL